MKDLVGEAAEGIGVLRNGIKRIIQEALHHYNGAVRYFFGPFVYMIDQGAENALRTGNFFYIVVRFSKEFAQPVFTADCAGKIEFMKNRKLLFFVKD